MLQKHLLSERKIGEPNHNMEEYVDNFTRAANIEGNKNKETAKDQLYNLEVKRGQNQYREAWENTHNLGKQRKKWRAMIVRRIHGT